MVTPSWSHALEVVTPFRTLRRYTEFVSYCYLFRLGMWSMECEAYKNHWISLRVIYRMSKGTHLNQPATICSSADSIASFWMYCYQHILPASLSTHVWTCDYSSFVWTVADTAQDWQRNSIRDAHFQSRVGLTEPRLTRVAQLWCTWSITQ